MYPELLRRSQVKAVPDPTLKGKKGGNCNRTACQAPEANWYNPYTYAFYCECCADELNRVWKQQNRVAVIQGREPIMTKQCEFQA